MSASSLESSRIGYFWEVNSRGSWIGDFSVPLVYEDIINPQERTSDMFNKTIEQMIANKDTRILSPMERFQMQDPVYAERQLSEVFEEEASLVEEDPSLVGKWISILPEDEWDAVSDLTDSNYSEEEDLDFEACFAFEEVSPSSAIQDVLPTYGILKRNDLKNSKTTPTTVAESPISDPFVTVEKKKVLVLPDIVSKVKNNAFGKIFYQNKG